MAGQSLLLKSLNFMNGWILSANSYKVNIVAVQIQNPIRTLKLETKERLKTLNIPEKPKRPLTPYFQFLVEKRRVLQKENPSLKLTEIAKKLSVDWKTVSSEQKEKYKDKYLKEKEVYDKEILKYNINLTGDQREALEEANDEKRKLKKKRIHTKLLRESGKPKRPLGPYLLYLKEQSLARNVSQKELIESFKGTWVTLPEAEKKKYKEEYAKENHKYETLLRQWENKMIAEGHQDLVRIKTLLEMEPKSSRILDLKKVKPTKQ